MIELSAVRSARPDESEHAPYYSRYISLVPDGDIVATLSSQNASTLALLRSLSEEKERYRYAPGKWSIREMVGHVCDAERVFGYRALRFARGDSTPLPGFDENVFVTNAKFDARPMDQLCDELETVRRASVALFDSLDAEEWTRRGTANDKVMSVRAAAWVAAGHELHHVNILRTRYL